jgi:hypothetical protein
MTISSRTKVLLNAITALLLISPALQAEQRIDLEGTAIFGNKESPNVLYVVPWRQAKRLTDRVSPQMNTVQGLLVPLERDAFRRRLEWHQTFGEKP